MKLKIRWKFTAIRGPFTCVSLSRYMLTISRVFSRRSATSKSVSFDSDDASLSLLWRWFVNVGLRGKAGWLDPIFSNDAADLGLRDVWFHPCDAKEVKKSTLLCSWVLVGPLTWPYLNALWILQTRGCCKLAQRPCVYRIPLRTYFYSMRYGQNISNICFLSLYLPEASVIA